MRILPYGDEAFLVETDSLRTVLRLQAALHVRSPKGLVDMTPGPRTLLVVFDRHVTNRATLISALPTEIEAAPGEETTTPEPIELPIAYSGVDLADVARHTRLTESEVVARHCQRIYTVALIGMAPGFYFLSGGDPQLNPPRRDRPHASVPVGAVGLAGEFTGIYPRTGPGGWQIIGQTTAELWDTSRHPACVLSPLTRIRFVQVA